jgi:GT2 family glycosyltransferase/2-polyprenyl-3-methyl-5-hydroxy-6-metoxy-1,4-benzoquinol methylase
VLRGTLQALRRQTVAGFDVVVVVDGTDQDVPPLDADSVLVQPHAGPGAARNRGVAATDRPLVLLLGDDMVPAPRLVERHLAVHAREPDVTVGALGHVVWHAGARPNSLMRWLDRSGNQFDFASIQGEDAGGTRFYSCNVSLKRALYDEVGGFDEDFVYYYEDLDIGLRLDSAGLRLRYVPDAVAQHVHHHDLASLRRRFRGIARGERLLVEKHPDQAPWFARQIDWAVTDPSSRMWPVLFDALPDATPRALLAPVRRRATKWWHRQVAADFLEGWHDGEDLADLRAHLGDRYDAALLRGHVQAVEAEAKAAADDATFYRTSTSYLYDLTVFAMSGTKAPYHVALRSLVPPGARLLDYGCGIGADGLRLAAAGYDVTFADFDSPSTRYLRWRLDRRGLDAPVVDIDGDVPGGFDAVYSFDVIEHVEDPFAFLHELEQRAALVMVNLLEPDGDDVDLHHDLPVGALLRYAARRGLVHYRRYHGRSHLIAYRTGHAGPRTLARSAAVLAAGRAAALAEDRLGHDRRTTPA